MAVSRRWTAGSICRGLLSALVLIWLVAVSGCDEQFSAAPVVATKEPEGCCVSGRIASTAWRDLGGGIERAVVSVWELPKMVRVEHISAEGERFEVRLPPGRYRLDYSAVGTRGATFAGLSREITVAEGQDDVTVGHVDLPISETTGLYGQPAPQLDGIIAWQDTTPFALKDLKGKVVVLEFFVPQGRVVRRYHHAGKPELEADLRMLLSSSSKRVQ